MGNLKETRTRISSVKSTQQITKAMKLVAASKLKKAQDGITQMRPYAVKLKEILGNLGGSVDEQSGNSYFEERNLERVLVVVLTSDKGLCGSFNGSSIKLAKKTLQEDYKLQLENGSAHLYCVGKKGSDFFKKRDFKVRWINDTIFNNMSFDGAEEMAEEIMKQFVKGKYDRVDIIYNRFINAATFETTREQFLPVVPEEQEEGEVKENNSDYIFEPGKAEILEELIPRSLKVNFYKTLLDSNAAEHGSRMTAMSQATDNAQELLDDLKLKYNKERQAAITTEILEIVGGAEALENG